MLPALVCVFQVETLLRFLTAASTSFPS
jgi:hypothetical protein